MKDNSYEAVMARKAEIIRAAVGVDYAQFESGGIAFDYEAMMASTGYTIEDIIEIQRGYAIGNTPLIELKNITALVRKLGKSGFGARIFVKDEAANPSGSFKVRRAATSIHHARRMGYPGAIAATSGNYGAAVASCCAKSGLKCIVVQECYDSRGVGQPEIVEKARKCEALGAEVVQLTVGPELFYTVLRMLEDTGYFNASLYTAFGVAGIETLGYELARQCREQVGKDPDVVVCTNAGGGNLTGTARGLHKANCMPQIVAASVNLKGLHMASDTQFNKKSFTTGHTGFGMPFSTWPDRSDVPRSAARPLRYMDRYVTVNQGEVFYTTELLARLEGIERGPAGNTSLAAAISLAQTLPEDAVVVVQETEYTGAGKHGNAQLSF
ncbi:MAG: PLP-dependent lyase/thiolase, partial [Clostridiales bacterium]|nr:PLP-dependent lyase/thiolase [Clostridiales bacterium]